MPTYDYVCDECSHEFELFQAMSDAVKRKCPQCDKLKLRRLIGSGAGVIFKGSGFYETDYRSASYKKAAEAEKKGASEGKPKAKEKTKPKDTTSSSDGSAAKKKSGDAD